MTALPDLWKLGEDTLRLYLMLLARLETAQHYERMVSVCREIRLVAKLHGRHAAAFTYDHEFSALCELGRFGEAWRVLREQERRAFGRTIPLTARTLRRKHLDWVRFRHIPILYHLGRYKHGCTLLERLIGSALRSKHFTAFDVLWDLINGDDEPSNWLRVTLTHYYRQLGKDMLEFPHWNRFVNKLHPRLLSLARIERDQLRSDASLLRLFFDRIAAERHRRLFSGCSSGQSDLVDSAAKVRARQKKIATQRSEFNERTAEQSAITKQKLRSLFPAYGDVLA